MLTDDGHTRAQLSIVPSAQDRSGSVAATPARRLRFWRRNGRTAANTHRVVFISWAPYCSRSDNIARELGGVSYMVYFAVFGSNPWTIALKYACQAVETLLLLVRDRPRCVICMNPPVVALVPVWLYCVLFPGRGYVIDHHTAAFVLRIYQRLYPVQRFFARRAIVNLVTNAHLAGIVESWGGRVELVGDVRVRFDEIAAYPHLTRGFNVTFVSRYSPTEPLAVVYDAARQLAAEGVHIFVTGDLRDATRDVIESRPDNVTLTGFLSQAEYAGLLRDSDAVMCLCTNDNTMQRGAYEALSVETPLVLSDWSLLRETFSSGAVYVSNTADAICAGIRRIRAEGARYRQGIRELRVHRAAVWEGTLRRLNERIEQSVGAQRQ